MTDKEHFSLGPLSSNAGERVFLPPTFWFSEPFYYQESPGILAREKELRALKKRWREICQAAITPLSH